VEAREDLERVEAVAEAVVEEALGELGQLATRGLANWPDGPEGPLNTTSWPRREVIEVGGELRFADTPAYGVGTFAEPDDAVELEELADGGVRLRNGQVEA